MERFILRVKDMYQNEQGTVLNEYVIALVILLLIVLVSSQALIAAGNKRADIGQSMMEIGAPCHDTAGRLGGIHGEEECF